VDPLLRAWTTAVGNSSEARAAGHELLDRYAEASRRYHDRRHLAEVLAALEALSGGAAPPLTVVCAAYAHDAVHDGAPDDERRSADLAADVLSRLGLPATVVDEVVRLVLLTVSHEVAADDVDGALLCDADLAVLAAAPERYRDYARDVRAEYAHVDDEAFRRGRRDVLHRLLARPRLYATEQGHRRWDAPARQNLRAEITALDEASDGADLRPADG
jgi:predicted metal-dependent HD superfamily phosphohydrolase